MDPKLQVDRVHDSASHQTRLAVRCRPVWQCLYLGYRGSANKVSGIKRVGSDLKSSALCTRVGGHPF